MYCPIIDDYTIMAYIGHLKDHETLKFTKVLSFIILFQVQSIKNSKPSLLNCDFGNQSNG